jgi:hypothetical protein
MTGNQGEKVGRFTMVRVIRERGPFQDHLCHDDDGVNWVVTTWPERSTVVSAAVVDPALEILAGLGAATPDSETEPLLDGYGDVIGLARPRALGWSVESWVAQEGTLSAGDVLWLTTTLLEALGDLRASTPQLLHGGISPADVFVTDDPRALVITGFAQARRVVSQRLAPSHDGDPPFIECVDAVFAPPEMRIGNHSGPATDLYGVASVALYALTGEGPRAFSGRMTELEDVLVTGYRAPRLLARFLAGALSPTVELRFQTVDAALDVVSGRAEAKAAEVAARPAAPVGQQFAPVPAKASALVTKAAVMGAGLSLPYVVLAVSALVGFGPFSAELPVWMGVLVAAFGLVASLANVGILVHRAKAESGVLVALEEFVLRLDGPELRAESKWSSLRDARLGGGGVEVVGAWGNGSGGWHDADLVALPDIYEIPPARLLAVIRETHDQRCPGGWLTLPDPPRRQGRPWWLAVPAALVLLGWMGGTGARVVGGPISVAPAATPEGVVEVDAVRDEPWKAFPVAERDPEAARKARADLERTVAALAAQEAAALAEGEAPLLDGSPGCPAGMSEFPLIDGGSLPAACVDGAGVMVRAARATPKGAAWFLVGWTETPARAYIACAAGGNCPPPVDDKGCRTDLARQSDWPANCVTTAGAEAYCATVGRRLCSADEWYAAAGAPTIPDRETFPNGAPDCRTAVIRDARGPGCGLEDAGATAARPRGASRFGAVDMVGNVAELVASGGGAALGGSWRSAPGTSGGLKSLAFTPGKPVSDVGFRCCRDLPPEAVTPPPAVPSE